MTTQDLINQIYSFIISKSDLAEGEEVTNYLAQAQASSYWKKHNGLLELFKNALDVLYVQDETDGLVLVTIVADSATISAWRNKRNVTNA